MISAKQKSKRREEISEKIEIPSKDYLTLSRQLCYNTLYFDDKEVN
jgi:hypothetical protein